MPDDDRVRASAAPAAGGTGGSGGRGGSGGTGGASSGPGLRVRPVDAALVGAALDAARALVAGGGADVPVGAVVATADGRVLATAVNARESAHDPTAHAEVLALRAAAAALGTWRLDGTVLAVTLEPCTMCAGAAVLARVGRVVFGAHDERAGAVGSLFDVVRDRRLNHRPEVVAGVREAECAQVLRTFFDVRRG